MIYSRAGRTSIILSFYLQTDNEDLKKYAHCMLVKSELMTKDGKFKKDVAMAKVPNAGKSQSPKHIAVAK